MAQAIQTYIHYIQYIYIYNSHNIIQEYMIQKSDTSIQLQEIQLMCSLYTSLARKVNATTSFCYIEKRHKPSKSHH
jgi:hypothetical protein